jgi:hypothetical protein
VKSWEQQPGEPDTAFAHFLAFLTLGVGRTIIRAYKLTHPESEAAVVSGLWREESSKWSWRKRANAFDLSSFRDAAREAAAMYAEAIGHLGKKALEAMASEKPEMRPRDWPEALNAFGHLASLFPADTILGLVDQAERSGDPAGAKPAEPVMLEEIPEEHFTDPGGDPWNRPPPAATGSPNGGLYARPDALPGETPEQCRARTGMYPPERHGESKPPPA